jgi:hypothetical protein
MTDYFSEALKEFASLSQAEHSLYLKLETQGARKVAYQNFCE